ncbi:MAG: hypothetical protein HY924_05530 [Elusimicrobia bacterium]|nr:hypothetical protein [Elusimicrobiota bacterium]
MKKLLGSVLAIAMLVQPGFASAELLKNFKLGGSIDMQSNASRNVMDMVTRMDTGSGDAIGAGNFQRQFNDRLNNAQFRVMVNMDWDVLDDVHAKITLRKNDKAWGTVGGTNITGNSASQTLTANTAIGGVGGGWDVGSVIAIDQAYVKIDKIMGHIDATVGRQYYGDAGDFVLYVGPKSAYGLATTAADLARVDIFSMPYVNLTGIAGKVAGSAVGTAAGADVDLRGIELNLKDVENINFNLFVYNRLTHATGPLGNFQATTANGLGLNGGNDNLYVYGFRSKVTFGGFTGKLKAAMNGGENRQPAAVAWDGDRDFTDATTTGDGLTPAVAAYKGYAFQLDAEYKAEVEDVASFTPWLHYAFGSGRHDLRDNQNEGFTAIAQDYQAGTLYSRFNGTTAMPLGNGIPCVLGAVGCGHFDANGSGTFTAADGGVGIMSTPKGVAGGIAGNGLQNRMIWGAGLKVTPAMANKLTVALSFFDYRWADTTKDRIYWCASTGCTGIEAGEALAGKQTNLLLPNTYHNGAVNTEFGTGRGQRHIGSELDLDLTWKHSDNVTFQAGVASFRPGKYIQEVIRDQYNAVTLAPGSRVSANPTILAYGDMHIKF